MSLNGYSYVEGNPVNMADPSGKTPAMAMLMNSGLCVSAQITQQNDCGCFDAHRNALNPWALYYCLSRCESNNRDRRCNELIQERERLKDDSTLDGCKRLVRLIDYAATHFSYQNASELSDDISCALTKARGAATIVGAVFAGFEDNLRLGAGGWRSEYDDDTTNQAYHLWSYVNTTAQGGSVYHSLLGEVGNYLHECLGVGKEGIFKDPEATIQDVRLAIIGNYMGTAINQRMIRPEDLAEFVRRTVCNDPDSQPFPFSDADLGLYADRNLFCRYMYQQETMSE